MSVLAYRLEETSPFIQKLLIYNEKVSTENIPKNIILCFWGIEAIYSNFGGGGPTPFFPNTHRNLVWGWKKWGKKYMKREGNKLSIFKIEKIPIFSHDATKFGFGDGKKYMEREGKSIRFNNTETSITRPL